MSEDVILSVFLFYSDFVVNVEAVGGASHQAPPPPPPQVTQTVAGNVVITFSSKHSHLNID